MFQLINNLTVKLAIDLAPDATEMVVRDQDLGEVSQYDPAKTLSFTLVGDEELNQYEIVYATSRTGTTLTITRGEENTSAGYWPAGTSVIAALTAQVLQGVTSTPTSADQVSYGGGNFGSSSTMEQAMDDVGNAIVRLTADTEYYESVQQRVGGGLFSGGAAITNDLRWQGSAKRFTTAGFGVVVTTTVVIATPVVAPDVVLCLRCNDTTNYGSIIVTAYNNAQPTNFVQWNIPASAIPANNAWALVFGAASAATIGGLPNSVLADRVKVEITDRATGPVNIDINFLDVLAVRFSYLGTFIRVHTDADWAKVQTVAKYGFRSSVIISAEEIAALTPATIREAQVDGHRIYMTSNANFKAQTLNQIMVKLYDANRLALKVYIKPDGWVYNNRWNGPLDLDLTTSVRELVALVFARGVGIGQFRSAVEMYRFDDPLIVSANLAAAQASLTGTDKTAINIDLSALTVADLDTLFTAVVATKNFYLTTLDYQNADNIKSGTLDPARLPNVPPQVGGMPTGAIVARFTTTPPAGYFLCDGAVVSRTTYATLFAVIGTMFGAGDGSTTYNLPDLRGTFLRGLDIGKGYDINRVLGTPQTDDFRAHAHTNSVGTESVGHTHLVSGSTGLKGSHAHATNIVTSVAGSGYRGVGLSGSSSMINTDTEPDHSHSVSITSGGESAAHTHVVTINNQGGAETRPRNVAVNYFIRY